MSSPHQGGNDSAVQSLVVELSKPHRVSETSSSDYVQIVKSLSGVSEFTEQTLADVVRLLDHVSLPALLLFSADLLSEFVESLQKIPRTSVKLALALRDIVKNRGGQLGRRTLRSIYLIWYRVREQ